MHTLTVQVRWGRVSSVPCTQVRFLSVLSVIHLAVGNIEKEFDMVKLYRHWLKLRGRNLGGVGTVDHQTTNDQCLVSADKRNPTSSGLKKLKEIISPFVNTSLHSFSLRIPTHLLHTHVLHTHTHAHNIEHVSNEGLEYIPVSSLHVLHSSNGRLRDVDTWAPCPYKSILHLARYHTMC